MALAFGLVPKVDAATITVATFADPSNVSTSPLFTFTKGTGTTADPTGSILSGSWLAAGLTLVFSPTSTLFPGTTFSIDPLVATGGGCIDEECIVLFGAGSFTFKDMGGTRDLLKYSWTSGRLNDSSFGRADTLVLDRVDISVPAGSPLSTWTFENPEAFAFSFANPVNTIYGTLGGFGTSGLGTSSWTAAFTSSATTRDLSTIPEPGSLILLGSGLLGLGQAVRRRVLRRKTAA